MSLAVSMKGIDKRFGTVHALRAVDLDVQTGSLHAVVGENGAGKTTLMRILYGALKADSGSVTVAGTATHFARSADAIAAGIGMVSQHYGIIPELTCLQNLILGAEGGWLIDMRRAAERADALASQMGVSFDWFREASTLSPAGAQKLEILKLLWREAKIMILDEPTAMLSPADGEALFTSLEKLTAAGSTVILVTHRLPEVFEHCSRVTVLRSGQKVADLEVRETTPRDLARLIVGGEVVQPVARDYDLATTEMLKVTELKVKGYRGDIAVNGVNFAARKGELVGIAGVDGSGQRELFQALLGTTAVAGGDIFLEGDPIGGMPTQVRIERGMRSIPEDRHAEGVVDEWSLEENGALGLQRLAPFADGRLVNTSARREKAQSIADRFGTKHGGLTESMASLSGGNQQRFVAARALELDPRVILAFQPARGLDLNATEKVYQGIREACKAGAAAIVVSFDLDELLGHCDRVVVMRSGQLFEAPSGREKDRDAIGALMVGAT